MYKIKEKSLDWALKHLSRFSDSDFFPRLFEFKAISYNWNAVKDYILKTDLEKYTPKTPFVMMAPKLNGTFRTVHQLDPVDALIYTALVYQISIPIEKFRAPKEAHMACSYRIFPDDDGSFFKKHENNWIEFTTQSEKLSEKFCEGGYVLNTDIADFYSQIYLHRVNSILSEENLSKPADIVEKFLSNLNSKISQGIPVGPAASIIISEVIMADIDNKIQYHTSDYTRYVDDMRFFFKTYEDAIFFLHEISKYLYCSHRLSLSGEKTNILPVSIFKSEYLNNEEATEEKAVKEKLEDLLIEYPYLDDFLKEDDGELYGQAKLDVMMTTYRELFQEKLFETKKTEIHKKNNLEMLRHLLKKAKDHQIPNLLDLVLNNFNDLILIIREVIRYIQMVIDANSAKKYEDKFQTILKSPYLELPYVNMWVFTLFQSSAFKEVELNINYNEIKRFRERALIAMSRRNRPWIKSHKDQIDSLGYWDKRAIIYSSSILSCDEMKHWLRLVSSKGDIVEKSLASYLQKKN